jgi:hypothetical protein
MVIEFRRLGLTAGVGAGGVATYNSSRRRLGARVNAQTTRRKRIATQRERGADRDRRALTVACREGVAVV